MAGNDHSENHTVQRLTAREIGSLADRTLSRALSVLFDVPRPVRRDMLLCSACLRVLAAEHVGDAVLVDVWSGEVP
jgi:hypothetical protein